MEKMLQKRIPIVFSSDNNYAKYLSIAISSVCKYNSNNLLFIYILHTNISKENRMKLEMLKNDKVSIEFINVEGELDEKKLFVDGRTTKESYYRILTPKLLPQWEKVLYLDVDIICMRDIAEWYDIDIGENWVGGVVCTGNENRAEYVKEHLGIDEKNYIYAGGIVINNKELRKMDWLKMCEQALEEKGYFKWHDQDLINMLCYKHIYFYDPKWNMTVGRMRKEQGGLNVKELTKEMVDCYVIHYASLKPWRAEMSEIMTYWWKYVNDSPFVTELMEDYCTISDGPRYFLDLCGQGKVSLACIIKCLLSALRERIMSISKVVGENRHGS